MDICKQLDNLLLSAVSSIFDLQSTVESVSWTISKSALHGDFSTNFPFIFAKKVALSPSDCASRLKEEMMLKSDFLEKIDVVGGFLNVTFKMKFWSEFLSERSAQGFTFPNIGNGDSVNVEFVSANPTGPLHLGHIRGAIIFDVLSELMSLCGFEITREYIINDAGVQIEVLLSSILHSVRVLQGITDESFPEGSYSGQYIQTIASQIISLHSECDFKQITQQQFNEIYKTEILESIMSCIRSDLAKLGIEYNVYTSEMFLHENHLVEDGVELLRNMGFISEEELPAPKGKSSTWERRKQLVFLAKNFGDDENRALTKSDGKWTYFASDVGYHYHKLERGFKKMIVGLGADHAGYVKRLTAVVAALSSRKASIDVRLYNLVNLFRDGKQVKLSKRNGNLITLEDVLEDGISADELRFAMLTKSSDVLFDFDIGKFVEHSSDNPIFYVQYAYARCSSVLSKCSNETKYCDASLLSHESERELIKTLAKLSIVVSGVVHLGEVHKLIFYLLEVAERFHALWNAGMKDQNLRFISDDADLTSSRLTLVKAVKNTIEAVFLVLKIKPMAKM